MSNDKNKIDEDIKNYPKYIFYENECICEEPGNTHLGVDAPTYAFEVFQMLDENGKALPLITECDNCGRKWEMHDFGVTPDLVDMNTALTFTKEQLMSNLHPQVAYQLEKISANIAVTSLVFYLINFKHFNYHISWKPKINRYTNKVKYYSINVIDAKTINVQEVECDLDFDIKMNNS